MTDNSQLSVEEKVQQLTVEYERDILTEVQFKKMISDIFSKKEDDFDYANFSLFNFNFLIIFPTIILLLNL